MEKKWKQDTKRIMRHKNQRNKYTTLLHKLRTDQISYIISENINNSYHLSKSLNSMLHRNVSSPLPPHDDETELVHNCSNFFEEKIYKIRTCKLDKEERPKPHEPVIPVETPLLELRKVTENDEILPSVTDIIN